MPYPQPYEVVKHVPVHTKEYVKYPVHVPQPYPGKYYIIFINFRKNNIFLFFFFNQVERKVPVHIPVTVEKPYPVKVFVPQPYEVIKKVPVHVPVHVPVPVVHEKKVPYEVS